jgi:hypothetical protein
MRRWRTGLSADEVGSTVWTLNCGLGLALAHKPWSVPMTRQ